VEEWKIAAAGGELTCCDCKERVYLAAGPIMEPYFAHYDKQLCEYGNLVESEELKKGKRLLYQLLSRSYPNQTIHARYHMKNGMYSTCFVKLPGGLGLAIDYRLQNTAIDKFLARDEYYKAEKVKIIYILGSGMEIEGTQLSWYENLVQKAMGYCVFLDTQSETLRFKKRYDYKINGHRQIKICQMEYSIQKLLMHYDGNFLSDFSYECQKLEDKIQKEKDSVLQLPEGIRPDILQSAIEHVKLGEDYLVSQRYLDYIRSKK
jgi:competence CoiA-like predicted nuclease